MAEPTGRSCYAASLTDGERERFNAEPVTGCVFYCPKHQSVQDDLMSRVDWSKVVLAKPISPPVSTERPGGEV